MKIHAEIGFYKLTKPGMLPLKKSLGNGYMVSTNEAIAAVGRRKKRRHFFKRRRLLSSCFFRGDEREGMGSSHCTVNITV